MGVGVDVIGVGEIPGCRVDAKGLGAPANGLVETWVSGWGGWTGRIPPAADGAPGAACAPGAPAVKGLVVVPPAGGKSDVGCCGTAAPPVWGGAAKGLVLEPKGAGDVVPWDGGAKPEAAGAWAGGRPRPAAGGCWNGDTPEAKGEVDCAGGNAAAGAGGCAAGGALPKTELAEDSGAEEAGIAALGGCWNGDAPEAKGEVDCAGGSAAGAEAGTAGIWVGEGGRVFSGGGVKFLSRTVSPLRMNLLFCGGRTSISTNVWFWRLRTVLT